jgi:hypothetical protein
MAGRHAEPAREADWLWTNPWPAFATGLGAALLAFAWKEGLGASFLPVRLVLIGIGLLGAGAAVAIRFRGAWDHEEKLTTTGVLAGSGVAVLFCRMAMDDAWDTAIVVLNILALVGFAGAVLVWLPRLGRRLVVSLLLLFHFGGIVTAITSVPPAGQHSPWVTMWLWTRIYHPYLEMCYIHNAYHFYSPEPGPPTLLWFYIQYEDGSFRAVKIPNRDDFPTRLNYQRRLALTESVNQIMPSPPMLGPIGYQREKAIPIYGIPIHPEIPVNLQYQQLQPFARMIIASYAQYVARHYPSEVDPTLKVKHVKAYRVIHGIAQPGELVHGLDPLDPTYYRAYYEGKFNTDGELLDPEGNVMDYPFDKNGVPVIKDPMLYWLVPIYRMEKEPENKLLPSLQPRIEPPKLSELELRDYLEGTPEKPGHAYMKDDKKD